MVEPPQRTAKQHPIKAGHHTLDLFLEFGDKLLHGVSPYGLALRIWTSNNVHPRRNAKFLFAACRYAGQVANLRGGWLPPPVRCEHGGTLGRADCQSAAANQAAPQGFSARPSVDPL